MSLADPVCHQIPCNTRSREVTFGIKIKCSRQFSVFSLHCKLQRITSLSDIITYSGTILDLTSVLHSYTTVLDTTSVWDQSSRSQPTKPSLPGPVPFFPLLPLSLLLSKCNWLCSALVLCTLLSCYWKKKHWMHGPASIPDTLLLFLNSPQKNLGVTGCVFIALIFLGNLDLLHFPLWPASIGLTGQVPFWSLFSFFDQTFLLNRPVESSFFRQIE